MFFRQTLPTLIEAGILRELRNKGGGTQRHFRLSKPMAKIARALAESGGSYQAFLGNMTLVPEDEDDTE
jgi:hypothetical protein